MKKHVILIGILALSLALSACSAVQNSSIQAAGTVTPGAGQDATLQQLALGTIKLDDQIDAEQAAALLPLWKAVRSLSESDTTATEEMAALVTQLQGGMTDEQLQTIQSMAQNPQDWFTIAQEEGIDLAGGGAGAGSSGSETTRFSVSSGGGGMAGGPPDGGMPPGGGMGGDGSGTPPDMAQLESSGQIMAQSSLNSAVLDAVIKFLQDKVQ